MSYIEESYDAIIIGGGHAGTEAALACARLGLNTIMFAVSLDSIAMMPCNPSIGGTSKGHLVREIDALGGEMGKNIDRTFLQSRMLNTAKGPAVHSLRAQADKFKYAKNMKMVLENTEGIVMQQSEVTEIIVETDSLSGIKSVKGVKIISGLSFLADRVIIATGTYLKAKCIYGEVEIYSGPNGLQAANNLTQSLVSNGIEMYRFKTGTPARIDKKSINFDKMEEQKGDEHIVPFSFSNTEDMIKREQISCWLTYTNSDTHTIIENNLNRSPLYSGVIEGTGPRYCPSIEDKVVRFKDKERHQIFLEPEGEDTNEMYVQGMSTSLPEDVQKAMLRTLPGLENANIMRAGYAIEYDCINPLQLELTLEFKDIKGLYSAGQFNGSSGYEEAAAQGLVAGINASLSFHNKPEMVIDRSEAYIGVLIDDLVTKGTNEPYRMMTSRAEYRLLLRQDNADIRLRKKGYEAGLIRQADYDYLIYKMTMIESEVKRLKKTIVGMRPEIQSFLEGQDSTLLRSGMSLHDLLKRPEISYTDIIALDPVRPELRADIIEQINIQIKYEGYIKRQEKQVQQFKKLEKKQLPDNLDFL
jgi:tRNA uridine 5-carboxymethylaminomethyl modification enzyme